MVNIEINLAVSGVTTIPIANTETEVILHVWYDGNDTFYHNIHRVFLENENDILTCQVWFQQIGQVETEAELLLQDAIRVINIAPNSKKTLIIVAVDKTKIGGERFFAENISGDISVDTSTFITDQTLANALTDYYTIAQIDDKFNTIVQNLNQGSYLTAKQIIDLVDTNYNTTAILDYASTEESIVVKSNPKETYFGLIFCDWDLSLGSVETAINDSAASIKYGQLTSPPEHIFTAQDGKDIEIVGCTFASIRHNDFFTASSSGATPVDTGGFAYKDKFSLIIDISNLQNDDFIRISINGILLALGIMRVTAVSYPQFSPVPSTTLNYPYRDRNCFFGIIIRKDGVDKRIISLPAYNLFLPSTPANSIKPVNVRMSSFDILANSSGWRVGDYFEGNTFGNFNNQNYITCDPILPSYFSGGEIEVSTSWNDNVVLIPLRMEFNSDGTRFEFNMVNFPAGESIKCKIKFCLSGMLTTSPIQVYQKVFTGPSTSVSNFLFNLNTVNYNGITVIDFNDCIITQTTFTYTTYYNIKNQTFYDWNINSYGLTLFNKTTTSLATAEISAINNVTQASQNFVIPAGAVECIVDNIKFYRIRSKLYQYVSSSNINYTPFQALSKYPIIFSTTSTIPVLLTIKSMTLYRGCPFVGSVLFPNNSFTSTSQYKSYHDSDFLFVRVDEIPIGLFDAKNGIFSTTASAKFTLNAFFNKKQIFIKQADNTIYVTNFKKSSIIINEMNLIYYKDFTLNQSLTITFTGATFTNFVNLLSGNMLYVESYDLSFNINTYTLVFPRGADYDLAPQSFVLNCGIGRQIGQRFNLNIRNSEIYVDLLKYQNTILSLIFTKNTTSSAAIPSIFLSNNYLFTTGYVFASDLANNGKVYFVNLSADSSQATINVNDFQEIFSSNSTIYFVRPSGFSKQLIFILSPSVPSFNVNFFVRKLTPTVRDLIATRNGSFVSSTFVNPENIVYSLTDRTSITRTIL